MRLSIAIAATLFSSAPAVAADATTFRGTLGKIPVILEMADAADSGTFVARYAYMSKGVDIPLHGRIDLDDGLTMEEEAPCTDKTCKNAAGELLEEPPIAADWTLESGSDGKQLRGTWKDRKSGKSLPISLERAGSRSLGERSGESIEDLDPISNTFSSMDEAITPNDLPYDFLKLDYPVRQGEQTEIEGATIRVDSDPRTDTAYPTIARLPGADTAAINTYLKQRWLQFQLPAYSCKSKIYLGMGWFGGLSEGGPGYEDGGAAVTIEYLTPRLLGLVENGSYFCGGAHPSHFETRHFADIRTGKQIYAERLLKDFVPKDVNGKEIDPAALSTVDYFEYRPTDALIKFVSDRRKKSDSSAEDNCADEMDGLIMTNLGVYFTMDELVFNLKDLPYAIFACTGDVLRIPLKDARPLLNEQGARLLLGG